MSLKDEIKMADFWIDRHGLEYSLISGNLQELAKDPAIASALIDMKNAERAILSRIRELFDSQGCDDD